jgi:HEAT repeat protein
MHRQEEGLPLLLTELKNSDQVVRHYAALALEDIGQKARPALDAIKAAKDDKYGYVRRLADRLVRVLEDQEQK